MTQRHLIGSLFLTSGGLALVAAVVQAQAIPAGCQVPVAARRKLLATPHHTYVTETEASGGRPARTTESISTLDATYIQLRTIWRKSPISPQDMLKQLEENLRNSKGMSCQQLGDESVDGSRAAVYMAHSETAAGKSDAKMWVAKGTGLVLKEEEEMFDGTAKRHMSVRYDYQNVRAPAGVP